MGMSMELERGVGAFIQVLIEQAKSVFEFGRERELHMWASEVESEFFTDEVQSDIAFGLRKFREELIERSGFSDDESAIFDDPVAYTLLINEFQALYARAMRMADLPGYGPIDHSLDLGDVALESLKEAVGSHPSAKAFVSLLIELVKLAKAIAKRIKGGS